MDDKTLSYILTEPYTSLIYPIELLIDSDDVKNSLSKEDEARKMVILRKKILKNNFKFVLRGKKIKRKLWKTNSIKIDSNLDNLKDLNLNCIWNANQNSFLSGKYPVILMITKISREISHYPYSLLSHSSAMMRLLTVT